MATKEALISVCEREFILNLVGNNKRLDGRDHLAGRALSVIFGVDHGCCMAILGNTRVLAQVSCEVMAPKLARPTEGLFQVNVEISPMADTRFEVGRPSDLGVETSRLIERCLRESKCLDLESLCIVAKEKVWSICVDVKVMIHDGNIVECASIAAVAALSHFRRPHVSVIGTDVTVYPIEEHCPVPLAIHHLPFCISFAMFEQGKYILVDPTELEEQVADGKIVIAMNSLREICTEHMSGTLLLTKEKILQCTNIAASRAQEITKLVKKVLEEDSKKRAKNEVEGFSKLLHSDTILSIHRQPPVINLKRFQFGINNTFLPKPENDAKKNNDISVFFKAPGIASLGEGKSDSWGILHPEEEFEEDTVEEIVAAFPALQPKQKHSDEIMISEDSEEEEEPEAKLNAAPELDDSSDDEVDLTKAVKGATSRDWYPKTAFL